LSNSSNSNKSFKGKTMAVNISFASFSSPTPPTGVSFSVGTGTVAQVLNISPTLPISLPRTGLTADNLTFIGLFADGSTVWRITNAGPAVEPPPDGLGATLSKIGESPTTLPLLPADSFTFVRAGTTGTYELTIEGATFTKAAGTQPISLGAPPATPPATTVSRFSITDSFFITGSDFNDSLVGGQNRDTLKGGLGDDNLNGLNGNDLVEGEAGNDTLLGGGQNDTLIGGAGNDVLTGGQQADRFTYNATTEGIDTITDFTIAQGDVLAFQASAFTGLNLGTTLIYNSVTGALSFNSTQLATLSTGLALTAAQIVTF